MKSTTILFKKQNMISCFIACCEGLWIQAEAGPDPYLIQGPARRHPKFGRNSILSES